MTSKIKVDNIENQCGGAVVTKCGGTTTIAGTNVNATTVTATTVTATNVVGSTAVKSNAIQASDGGNLVSQSGTTITLGASGDTVTLAAGASQSGFGQTYSAVSWDTTPKTGLFTAVSGVGYFCNTTLAPFTVTLPAGTAGDIVAFADYAATWQTNNVTVAPNGTDKIGSVNLNAILNTKGQSVTFVFVDSTQGWINTMDSTSNVRGGSYIIATGGTPSQDGDYEIRTFTGPGTFEVTGLSDIPANNTLDYLVVAGGGGSSCNGGGGGGAGGFRLSNATCMPAPLTSPLATPTGITATVTSYPIIIGAGGDGNPGSLQGGPGANSTFSTITSAGGGGGGGASAPIKCGLPGGSGGGAHRTGSSGSGNTPPVSPSQGNNGAVGDGGGGSHGGGGGGGGVAGSAGGGGFGGAGGNGSYTKINPATGVADGPVGSARYYAGGGGGGGASGCNPAGGAGGGGDGLAGPNVPGQAPSGTVNTGGGGGGGSQCCSGPIGGNGGSGIVIIRYKSS